VNPNYAILNPLEAFGKALLTMTSFPQHPGEPAEAFEQLLLHRDFCPGRQFSQTTDVVGCSESTLRRRAEQWTWVERLEAYDSDVLQKVSEARTTEDLARHPLRLEAFRQEQLSRMIARRAPWQNMEGAIARWVRTDEVLEAIDGPKRPNAAAIKHVSDEREGKAKKQASCTSVLDCWR